MDFELIKSYEEENLRPRSWALSGEVAADGRGRDELLEHRVEVDYRAPPPPQITAEKATQLEAVIAKRIKDNLYDDVTRKLRVNEALVPAACRNKTGIIEQNVRKSLAEVYGDKYIEQHEGGHLHCQENDKQLDPQVGAVKQDLDALFLKLDALGHFIFRPQMPPNSEELKIVNNMPSLRVEEVGPNAAVEPEVNLMAPEEVAKHLKSAPKAAEERTETDRKRQRRQKKKKQHILASIGAMNGGDGEAKIVEMGRKKKRKTKTQ